MVTYALANLQVGHFFGKVAKLQLRWPEPSAWELRQIHSEAA